ncbi:MAG: chemotaxis response regulator protein-glutamate methylesterase [Verrucomicrobia bacterium]|nr:chemotaxis response regulator protein-glutamate methylesterase [Verrucomicrobiota bacterium]
MRRIRVLIVDDSIVVRRLVSDVLAADPALEVAGVAATGRIALAKIPQVNPDVVALDVEMPDLDGISTLRELRKTYPVLPVIMFSTLTERGAATTIEALTMGANDYVTKPANVGSVTAAMSQVRDALIPKIKVLCARQLGIPVNGSPAPALVKTVTPAGNGHPPAPAAAPLPQLATVDQCVQVLAIGTSTGGPNVLADLLTTFPENFPVPILIVQHMPPVFTRMLADHLTAKCRVPVVEGTPGDEVRAGQAWIAPGGFHMTVAAEGQTVKIHTNQNPPENSCRPAVDVLFRSVAEIYRGGTLGVVLTGMGHDGLRGSECIRSEGGRILAQDEASSVVWGMAGAVARAGLADGAWAVPQLAQLILRRLQVGRPNWRPSAAQP